MPRVARLVSIALAAVCAAYSWRGGYPVGLDLAYLVSRGTAVGDGDRGLVGDQRAGGAAAIDASSSGGAV